MLMENMTVDKQLNLSRQPLSVRRHPSPAVLEKDDKRNSRSFLPSSPRPPPYESELESGPVSSEVTVPFQWEKSPGRPKDERTHETHIDGPPVSPKLPPGRIFLANTITVVNKSLVGKSIGSRNVLHSDETWRGIECANDTQSGGEEDEVDGDDMDTFSRTESFFLSCSVSGISGLDDSDGNPFGTFLTDPQAKEFMIDRFLPAAKARISKTPEYARFKKPPIFEDNPRQLKKKVAVDGDKQPQLRYGPSYARRYYESQYAIEEEKRDDEYDEHENFHPKVCGLFPKFCLKSLFMSRASRTQARSSRASTCSKTGNFRSSQEFQNHFQDARGIQARYSRASTCSKTGNFKSSQEFQNHFQDAVDSEISAAPIKQATQSLGKQTPKAEKLQIFPSNNSEFLPPPLPKPPSDSWLARTLPSMSAKNSSRHSRFATGINTRNQSPEIQ